MGAIPVQFFDEVQFEAYRESGYRLTIKMLESPVPQGVTYAQQASAPGDTRGPCKSLLVPVVCK